jgi:uncharacterized membrane protein
MFKSLLQQRGILEIIEFYDLNVLFLYLALK